MERVSQEKPVSNRQQLREVFSQPRPADIPLPHEQNILRAFDNIHLAIANKLVPPQIVAQWFDPNEPDYSVEFIFSVQNGHRFCSLESPEAFIQIPLDVDSIVHLLLCRTNPAYTQLPDHSTFLQEAEERIDFSKEENTFTPEQKRILAFTKITIPATAEQVHYLLGNERRIYDRFSAILTKHLSLAIDQHVEKNVTR